MFLKSYKWAGVGEKMQYLAHEFNDNTIRFVLRYPGQIQAEVLQRAVQALVQSVDVLHASFVPGHATAYWRVNEEYQAADYFTFVTAEDPVTAAINASLSGVAAGSRVQLHCTLAQGEKEAALALRISHLCADGSDGKYLLCKLAEAYQMLLETGDAKSLQVKNGNRAAEQVYENLNSREIISLFKNPLTGVKTGYPFADEEPGEERMVGCMIEKEVVQRARIKAKQLEASVNDVLLAACYQALGRENEPISIMSMMDLRRHCRGGESEGLCNMSGSMPTVLRQGVPKDFAQTLALIAAQTRSQKNDPLAGLDGMPLLHGATRTLPLWLLLRIGGRVYGNMSVGLTNLGNIDCATLKMGDIIPSTGLFGGPLKKKPGMQISAASFDGSCALCVFGQYTRDDAQRLQLSLGEIKAIISAFAQEENG